MSPRYAPAAIGRVDFSRGIEGGPINHGFDSFFGTACCPTTDWLYAFVDGYEKGELKAFALPEAAPTAPAQGAN
ncbi:MAG: hypothetical protein ABI680_07040 [Chthoniobacteraceae bacterium]